jgi:hypothetical protein
VAPDKLGIVEACAEYDMAALKSANAKLNPIMIAGRMSFFIAFQV